jgi:hypothetical protein
VPRLIPGRYLVVALDPASAPSFIRTDADTLGALRKKAISVLIEVGQTATVELRVEK